MAQLKATDNYIWSLADVLGQGATGAVYMARHKRTGEQYAVKTFNPYGQMRPYEVQMREFDVMRKLSHPNIVGLLAVEEEQTSRAKVIVMELCKGGSLFCILDEPTNAFGLPEEEFLKVLEHVAAGMDHVRRQGIVHRDIKPGNILRYIDQDGSSVYKLTDFGAARELQEDQPFMSLYGTEEYLHPDMYERALLDGPRGTEFTAQVDLWSLGVTLYHVATGELPFRPYGGRRNRLTMHKITTEKASGVISGIQKQANGAIDWSRELPATCRLSKGLRRMLTPLLARLMECNQERTLSFPDFFEAVEMVIATRVVHVFCVNTCESLRVYLEPSACLANLQEEIARQTDIEASNQLILLDQQGRLSDYVTAIQPVRDYPLNSVETPLYLLDIGPAGTYQGPRFHLPGFGDTQSSRTLLLDEDYKYVKSSAGILHLVKHYITSCETRLKLIANSAHLFRCYTRQCVDRLHESTTGVNSQCNQLNKHHALELQMCRFQLSFLSQAEGKQEEDELRLVESRRSLEKFQTLHNAYSQINCEITRLYKVSDSCLKETRAESFKEKFAENLHKTCEKKSKYRAEAMAKEADNILRNFKRDRELKKLSHNEEQLHKFERNKFRKLCTESKALFEACSDNLSTIHQEFIHWFQTCRDILNNIRQTDRSVSAIQKDHANVSQNIIAVLEEFSNWMCEIKLSPQQTSKVNINTGLMAGDHSLTSRTGTGRPKTTHQERLDINKGLESLQREQSEMKSVMERNTEILNKVRQLTGDTLNIPPSDTPAAELR